MSEGMSYKAILHEKDSSHSLKGKKHKVAKKMLKTIPEKHFGKTEVEMMESQRKIGRAYND